MRVAGRAGRTGDGPWSGPLRRLGRRVRRVAAGTGVLALALPLAWQSGAGGQHLDVPSAASVRSAVVRLADFVTGDSSPAPTAPRQQSGTAAGGKHRVPASQTKGLKHVTGHAPGQGKGQLPRWAAHPPTMSASGTFTAGSSVRGFDPAMSTLDQSGTTAQSDLYQNADGSYTRQVWSTPVNYQTSAGTWAPIDETLVPGSAGRWQEKANSVAVSFAASGSAPTLASLAVPGGANQIAFSLAGAGDVAATASGPAVTYPGILPGTDVTETATSNGLSEALTLDSAAAGSTWTFPLTLKGLTASLDGGSVDLTDAAGTVVAVIPPAVARSGPVNLADPESQASSPLTYRLVTDGGAPALEMSLDPSWLDAPGRVFPVTVDPTVSTDPQGSDYAQSDNGTAQTANNSGSTFLPSGTTTTSGSTYDDIDFLDYSALGSNELNAHITSASLKMFDAYASQCSAADSVSAYQVTGSWAPSQSMTYPGPAYGAEDAQWTGTAPADACSNTSGLAGKGGWLTLPFNSSGLALLNQWTANSATNFGFAVLTSLTSAADFMQLDSYNDGNVASSQGGVCTGDCRPYLSLTYSTTASDVAPQITSQFPANNTDVPTLTPELLASGTDPDSWPDPTLEYDFHVYDTAGQVVTSGDIASNDWSVPAGELAWGQTYYWTVQAYDGDEYSPNPQGEYFTTTVPQPLVTSQLSLNPAGPGFNPQTGNWTTSAADAQVPTVGPALDITRDYNSTDPRLSGAFGAGWSSVLDMKVSAGEYNNTGGTETEVVTYPDGEEVGFGLDPGGTTYSPPSGRYATLAAVSGGGFTLTDKNDTVYSFTQPLSSGVYGIGSITDADNRTETFTYNGSNQVTTITAASGRALTVSWTTPSGAAYPHVASVVTGDATAGNASTAQDWTYSYSGDRLQSACPPASATACTAYAYTAGSDYPQAVLDSGPDAYWRLDETSGGTAADSVLANEGADDSSYNGVTLGQDTGPLTGSSATAATFNGSAYVALPNNLVTSAAYQTISLWFKTSATNGVLFGSSADGVTETGTTSGDYTPELYIGSDGKLVGAFWDGHSSDVMTSTAAVDDGQWHNAVLADSGSGQQLYLDGQQIGTLSHGFASHQQSYDFVGAGYLGGGWPDEPSYSTTSNTGYAYPFVGDISDFALWSRQLTPTEVQSMYAAGTHPAALLTKLTQPSGSVYAQVTYDSLTGRVTNDTDSNGGTWQVSRPTTEGSSQAWVSSVLGAKPADYYRLNDTGATQASDLAYDCACSSPATYNNVSEGVSNGPFADQPVTAYNGTSSYLSVPTSDTASGGPGSVGVWFKTTGTNEVLYSEQAGPVTGSPSKYYDPVLYIGKDGKLNGELWDGNATTAVSDAAVNDGNWHYAVLAAGAASQSLYVDGTLQSTITGSVQSEPWTNAAAGTGFAGGPWPDLSSSTLAARWFTGDLAELAWYPYQLSAAQVSGQVNTALYASGYLPIEDETVTDPGGNALQYTYDLLNGGRALSYTDADGGITSYTYDTGGFPASTTDPDGDVTQTGYDVRGNLVSKTTCQDLAADECSTSYWTYYPDDTSTTLTPAGTNDEVKTYADGRSASSTDTTYQTQYAYDPAGDLTAVTTPPVSGYPSGRTTSYTYTNGSTSVGGYNGAVPPEGLTYQKTTPGGAVTTTLYDADGDVAQVTDPDGQRTVYGYDGLGRTITQTVYSDTYPSGLVTTYTYDANGDQATETDPAVTDRVTGAVHTAKTTTSYDPDGDVTSTVTADLTGGDASRTVTSTYNGYDQLATETDAADAKTTYTYDAYGNLASETDPDGNVTEYTYDGDGHLLTTTLENYTGSPPGSQAAAPLVEESRGYDPAGRLAMVTDAMGRTTDYFYTDNDLLAGEEQYSPDWSQSFTTDWYSYDGAGNEVEQWTNNGETETTYTVDAASRVTQQVTDPSGLDRTDTISYTPDDQQASVTDSGPDGVSQTTSYSYDPAGNVLSQSVTDPGAGGPAAWLNLTQSSGPAVADQISGGQPATATNVTWNGTAGTFTGTSGSQVATAGPVVDTTGSFTVAAWVDLAAAGTGSTQAVASQAAGTANGFTLGYDASSKDWQFARPLTDTASPSLASAESGAAAAAGTWTFLTGSFNANTGAMTLYVNGTAAGTATDATPIAAHGAFTIGSAKTAGAPGSWFNGQAYDVQVYPRALSAAQVSQLDGTKSDLTTGALTTTWTRDERGLPTSMTDPDGAVTSYSYDQAGQLTVTTQPPVTAQVYGGPAVTARPVTTTGYDTFGDTAETENPDGNVTTDGYDADGRPVSEELPAYTAPGSSSAITAVTTTAYDGDGNVTSTTDGLNDTTKYAYDQLGDQVTVTAPDNSVTTTAYDADGEPLSVTDPTGAVTESTYDYLGRSATSTQVERYSGAGTAAYTTSYSYNDASGGGWLSEETSPDGVTTQYSYDPAGEKTAVTNGAENTTSYAYNSLGEQTKVTDPDGTATVTGYDGAGNVISTADLDASGNTLATTSATFDGEGDQVSATDAEGNSTTFTDDPTGMVTQEVQPVSATSGITTSFGYDAAGNQTLYTDGNGSQWWDTYNSWGLEQSRVEPYTNAYTTAANSTFTLAYDADQNPVTETEPGGVTVASTYNNVGELTGQSGTGADAPTPTRTFGYNPAGDLTSASTSNTAGAGSNATSESFTYDDRGLVLTASGSAGSTSYGYNGDGLATSVADAAGTTSYTYDDADRLSTLANPVTGTTATYSYNSDSLVTGISYGSGDDTQSFGYDGQHRLTSDTLKTSSGTAVASVSYGYDADSEITSEATTGLAGAASNAYTYDEAGRLTSWNNGTTTTAYGYDSNGNLTQDGAKTYTYDARDELTGDGAHSYTYTARGTPSSEPGTSAPLPVTFDAYGDQATAGTRSYAYDALGRLTADTASAGGNYAFSYVGSTGTMASDGTSAYTWDPSGSVLAGTGAVGGGTSGVLALTDAHGNQVGQFTAAGASLAGSQSYDPWGNVTATTGTVTGLLGYQSAWTDTASGKDLMGARWYDPGAGDFTSADTVQVPADPDPAAGDPFAYAADEPLDLIDPTGHGVVPPGNAEDDGTTARIGNGTTSSNNYVADETAARIVERAVETAPNDAAKAAAARAAVAKIDAEQATAAKEAKAAAAREAAQEKAREEAEAKAKAKAAAEKAQLNKAARAEKAMAAADASARGSAGQGGPVFAPGCNGTLSRIGACPSEAGAAGTTAAQVKGAVIGALMVVSSTIPVGDAIEGIVGLVDAGDAAADAAADADAADAGDGAAQDNPSSCLGGSSFTAGTLVLLASGKATPISGLKPGDKVEASDTRTGKDQAETVTAVLVHDDTDLYDLTVKAAHGTAVIHTTSNHLFWDPYPHYGWIPAKHLKPGMHLKTPDGQSAVVVGGSVPAVRGGWMWDLTVPGNNDHDFYVLSAEGSGYRLRHADAVAVLVHNSSCISSADVLNDPKALEGLTPSQIDDLARNAGYDVQPGSASAANPATRYYLPGTNRSVGFRVLPSGVAGQSGIKAGAYLRFFGGQLAGIRVPLASP